jgi:hypothetical protein
MEKVAQQAQAVPPMQPEAAAVPMLPKRLEALGGNPEQEHSVTRKARQRVADAAAPT